jgi:hypothetical protein
MVGVVLAPAIILGAVLYHLKLPGSDLASSLATLWLVSVIAIEWITPNPISPYFMIAAVVPSIVVGAWVHGSARWRRRKKKRLINGQRAAHQNIENKPMQSSLPDAEYRSGPDPLSQLLEFAAPIGCAVRHDNFDVQAAVGNQLGSFLDGGGHGVTMQRDGSRCIERGDVESHERSQLRIGSFWTDASPRQEALHAELNPAAGKLERKQRWERQFSCRAGSVIAALVTEVIRTTISPARPLAQAGRPSRGRTLQKPAALPSLR